MKKAIKMAGYCKLCREQEIKMYGVVLNSPDKKHIEACKKAGCKHPAVYIQP